MLVKDFLIYVEQFKDKVDYDLIAKACEIAEKGHEGQLRKSGLPYITHPLNIAKNLLAYNFDSHTIAAAILHDTIEDTHITEAEIKEACGEDILNLVLGVTKLSKMRLLTREEAIVENFRKFILSFIGDIRILIIKLFDRLDNMRTISYVEREDKRRRIAQETLDIYVPLAERISLHDIKDELEDLAFEVVEPRMRLSILDRIEIQKKDSKIVFDNIQKDIVGILNEYAIDVVEFKGRVKRPYSIWKKIQRTGVAFEDIFDILAFRVVVNTVEDCYRVLYAIHSKYQAISLRFKDYISAPKLNNYRSLHTGIYYKNNIKLELQIRTLEMHQYAENGIAAHWNYKNPVHNNYDFTQYSWLKNLVSILNDKEADISDIYEYSKIEIFNQQIFVFTPKGEVVELPKGSCALDFAYAIHTDVGNKCKSAVIDGMIQPIFTQLKNGQKVEVHTDDKQEPQVTWLSFVKTGVAKLSIKKFLKQKYKSTISLQAHSILSYTFEKEGVNFYPELISKIMAILNLKSEQLFFERIIEGKVDIIFIIKELFPYLKVDVKNQYKGAIKEDRLPIVAKEILFSDCCYPLYGDSIVGVILPGDKVEIHHSSCEILYSQWVNNLNVVRVYWGLENNNLYKVKLYLKIDNKIGSFAAFSQILSENNVIIDSVHSDHKRHSEDFRDLYITIFLKDLVQLDEIIEKLLKSSSVKSAERYIN